MSGTIVLPFASKEKMSDVNAEGNRRVLGGCQCVAMRLLRFSGWLPGCC